MTFRTRRRFLGTAAGVGMAATAGCLSGGNDGDEGNEDDEPTEDPATGSDNSTDDESPSVTGTVLGDITIDNLHDAAHTVDVRVEINGETQAWVSKDVESRTGSVELEQTWDTTGGDFSVQVRLDGANFIEVTPENWNDPACISLIVVIDAAERLRVAGDTTGGFCAE